MPDHANIKSTRTAVLARVLEDTCSLASGWERPDELPRFVSVEVSGHGIEEVSWIEFHNDVVDAVGYFFTNEGDWLPEDIVDLDTGDRYRLKLHASLHSREAGAYATTDNGGRS